VEKFQLAMDFDGIVFDSPRFVEDFKQKVLIDNGVLPEVIGNYYSDSFAVPEGYTSKTHYLVVFVEEFLNWYAGCDVDAKKIKRDAESFLEDLSKYVFNDALELIKMVPKENRIIVSRGSFGWQPLKIEKSHASELFGRIFITNGKKSSVLKSLDRMVVFIDDKGNEVDEVKSVLPDVIGVVVNRTNGKYNHVESALYDLKVDDLKKVCSFIENWYNYRG
jgi:hypothetical protein